MVALNAASVVTDAADPHRGFGYAGGMLRACCPWDPEFPRMAVARLRPDGAPDVHFAPAGVASFRLAVRLRTSMTSVSRATASPRGGSNVRRIREPRQDLVHRDSAVVVALQGGSPPMAAWRRKPSRLSTYTARFATAFVSTGIAETRRLDTDPGWTAQWTRTGRAFNVWSLPEGDRLPVCRF